MKIFASAILILFSFTLISNAESSEDSLYEVAFQRMQNEGWTPVHVLGTMAKNNRDYIIVQTSFMSNLIIELPFMSSFLKGRYWDITVLWYGVSSMIDASGVEHSYMFSDSFEL